MRRPVMPRKSTSLGVYDEPGGSSADRARGNNSTEAGPLSGRGQKTFYDRNVGVCGQQGQDRL